MSCVLLHAQPPKELSSDSFLQKLWFTVLQLIQDLSSDYSWRPICLNVSLCDVSKWTRDIFLFINFISYLSDKSPMKVLFLFYYINYLLVFWLLSWQEVH